MPGERYKDETKGQIEILFSCDIPPRKIAADLNIDPSLVDRSQPPSFERSGQVT